jgi:protein AATF/BFR2
MTTSTKSKRNKTSTSGNIFDAVASLEIQDRTFERKSRHGIHNHQNRDVQRSMAAQAQTSIYSSLVESRILLQRSLLCMAQQQQQEPLEPTEDVVSKQHSPTTTTDTAAIEQCNEILAQLLQARHLLSHSPPPQEEDYPALVGCNNEDVLNERLQLEYDQHRDVWKEVLDRRHRDVRLHSGALTNKTQFRVIDSSFWQQVESTVQHDHVRAEQQQQQHGHTTRSDGNHPGYTLFDDSKVYQQLLKDFVDISQANLANGPDIASGKRLHAKNKKAVTTTKANVDRKASKGRKLRYTELTKLRNFTFPIRRSYHSYNDTFLDEDAWFRSLFGGVGGRGNSTPQTKK